MIKRKYLNYNKLECSQKGISSKSITVQDHSTEIQSVLQRVASGVVDPEKLAMANLTYGDFGLPNLNKLDALDLMRENVQKIKLMEKELSKSPEKDENAPNGDAPQGASSRESEGGEPSTSG